MGWVADHKEVQAKGGRSYMGGSGHLVLGATGGSILLSNPANSGKKLYLTKAELCSVSKVMLHIDIIYNPTANLPTATKTISNTLIGGPASVATLKAGTAVNLPSGGEQLSVGLHMQVDSARGQDFPPIVIPPNNKVCIVFPPAATILDCDLYWYEA